MDKEASYRYALLGIIGLVAFVAVVAIVKTLAPDFSFSSPTGAVTGMVVSTPAPPEFPPVELMLKEGKKTTITLQGIDYEIGAPAVVAADWTGKPSALILVNGVLTHRLYVDTSQILSGNVIVYITAVKNDTVNISIAKTYFLPPPQPTIPNSISDHLSQLDTKTYTLGGKDFDVTLLNSYQPDAPRSTLRFSINGVLSPPLKIGDTSTVGNATITLYDLFKMNDGKVIAFFTLALVSCGPVNQQTLTCRGANACCGGSCVALPDCTESLDGPISTCGDRPMYCCGGKLGFVACGGCEYDGKFYPVGAGFPTSDGCNTCTCRPNGIPICTMRACIENSKCNYNGQSYPIGTSFPAGDGCNTCSCTTKGAVCTKIACPPPTNCNTDADCSSNQVCQQLPCIEQPPLTAVSTGSNPSGIPDPYVCGGKCVPKACEYNGQSYPSGAGFPSSDGCNSCTCRQDGSVICTTRMCVADISHCSVNTPYSCAQYSISANPNTMIQGTQPGATAPPTDIGVSPSYQTQSPPSGSSSGGTVNFVITSPTSLTGLYGIVVCNDGTPKPYSSSSPGTSFTVSMPCADIVPGKSYTASFKFGTAPSAPQFTLDAISALPMMIQGTITDTPPQQYGNPPAVTN